jgi:hypothetical protein
MDVFMRPWPGLHLMNISIDSNDLKPLVEQVVAATLKKLEAANGKLGNRLAFNEPEAAALLGIKPHVLRDARLRGEISGSRVGKRILYERDEVLRFLRSQRNI